MSHNLLQYDERLAVVRLGPGADVPAWAASSSLFSVTATATETSLVCGYAGVPTKARPQGPFTALAVEGTLDFALTGVLGQLLAPLAESEIAVFVVSTCDTDWILVPADAAGRAADALRRAGHDVRPAFPATAPTSS